MLISIVVPAFNEEKLLGGVLRQLREATGVFSERGWRYELIVCDNNSTDQTAAIATAGGAQVVFEPVNQIARARNRGASIAAGEWLIFVDADSWPSPGLFHAVSDVIERGGVVGGGATVCFDERVWWIDFLTGIWNLASRGLGWAAGSFVFCDAAAFRAVGGFNQELYASEEIDLSQRLKAWGRNSGRRMRIITTHPLRTSARKVRWHGLGAYLGLLARAMISPRRFARSRQACRFWYDGRR